MRFLSLAVTVLESVFEKLSKGEDVVQENVELGGRGYRPCSRFGGQGRAGPNPRS